MRRFGLGAFILVVGIVPSAIEAQESVQRFTWSGARNGQAFWSPDGRRIAFVSDRENGWQIWTMLAEGGEAERLTTSAGPVGWPSWSADASGILFYAELADEYALLRLDLETMNVAPLPDVGFSSFRPLLNNDGRFLLFDGVRPPRRNHDIYVQELETGAIARLTDAHGYDSDARWSPDGESIVFHSDRDSDPGLLQVFTMTADGTEVRQLTVGIPVSAYPSWSPNGQCIVYTSESEGNRDVWLMDRTGGNQRRLTRHPGFDGDPSWHPREGRILFSTDRFGGQELAVLTLGAAATRLCTA